MKVIFTEKGGGPTIYRDGVLSVMVQYIKGKGPCFFLVYADKPLEEGEFLDFGKYDLIKVEED